MDTCHPGRGRGWRGALWALLAFAVVCSAAAASAQGKRAVKPQMAVVVESSGGLAMASRVRQLLAEDAGITVQSLEAFVARGQRPDLVITVTISRRRDIHVMYWDRLGVADSLEAPVPKAGGGTTGVVAASLAAALVRRNLPPLTAALAADPVYPHYTGRGRARSELSALSPDQLRLFLSRLADRSPRTDRLTVADF